MFPRTGIEPVTVGHIDEYSGPQLFEQVGTMRVLPTVNIEVQDSACMTFMNYIIALYDMCIFTQEVDI